MKEDNDRSLELRSLFHQEKSEDEEKKVVNYLDKVKGFAIAIVNACVITVSSTCCQLLEKRIPDFELNTIRSAVTWMFMVILVLAKRTLPKAGAYKMAIFLLHGIFASGVSLPYFIAVTLTAVTSVHCIFITSGITSGLIIFLLAVKEKITVKKVVCTILCITGVTLVVQPDFLFNGIQQDLRQTLQPENASQNNTQTSQHGNTVMNPVLTILGFILPILSGIFISSQTALVKKYPFIGQDVVVTGFWSLMYITIVSASLMGIFEKPTLPQNWMDVLYIVGHSFGYVVIWTTNILAAVYLSGNTINIILSTTVVLMLLPQYTVLSSIHPGHRNWIEIVGVVLVLLGSSLGSVLELLSQK